MHARSSAMRPVHHLSRRWPRLRASGPPPKKRRTEVRTLTECPVCGDARIAAAFSAEPLRPRWRDGQRYEIWTCAACDHRFQNPMRDFEDLARFYDSDYAPYTRVLPIDDAVREARETGRYRYVALGPGMRVMDVGCGSGAFLRIARELGAEVAGIEPSDLGYQSCVEHGLPVHHGMVESYLAGAPETFDLVTCNHVLEHHPEPNVLMGQMTQLLAPGGRLYIAVPNAGSLFSRWLRGDWPGIGLPVHVQQYTETSLRTLFERHGLMVETFQTPSDGALAASAMMAMRRVLPIPGRIARPLARRLIPGDGRAATAIDESHGGEALVAIAIRRDASVAAA
jgi:2-polyprenyl-3-methyl-5-hydroxy-6-metoxy-1,4-benzoquinol methylase